MILEKSWGVIREYVLNQVCTVRILEMTAGQSTSVHYHRLRDDMWIILDDGLEVEVDEKRYFPTAGDEFVIKAGVPHRIFAGETGGRVLEIDFGFTTEDDILQIEFEE
jgi:quercetin dioxygenase-like cupin family protein